MPDYPVDPDDVQVHIRWERTADDGGSGPTTVYLDDVSIGHPYFFDVTLVDPRDAPPYLALISLRHLEPDPGFLFFLHSHRQSSSNVYIFIIILITRSLSYNIKIKSMDIAANF